MVPCLGQYEGKYAVVGDSPYAVQAYLSAQQAFSLRDRLNGLKESPWYEEVAHDD